MTATDPFASGRDVYVPDGTKLGTIVGRYAEANDLGAPRWIAVDGGVSDGPYLVPTSGAGSFSEGLMVRYSIEQIQTAPSVATFDGLSGAQMQPSYEHYGRPAHD